MLLQSKLASTSMTFKDVLEVRTQNMKESKDRTEQFMSSTSAAAANQAPASAYLPRLVSRAVCLTYFFLDSLLFGGPRSGDPMGDGSASRGDVKGKGRARPNGDVLALDLLSVFREAHYSIQAHGTFHGQDALYVRQMAPF